MRWFVHIGIQKTGSKAIQTWLSNESDSSKPQLCYPRQGREGVWHEPIYRELLEGDASTLRAALSEAHATKLGLGVLSCESFFDLPSHCVEMIRRHLEFSTIILFIREQADALNSLLNQYAKAHRVTVEEVIMFERGIASYNPTFDYELIIRKWASVFGENSIRVLIYDKKVDSVRLLADAIGFPLPSTYKLAANPNPALDRTAYEAFLTRKHSIRNEADLPALVDSLHRDYREHMVDTFSQDGFSLLDDDTRSTIMSNYAASNEWVRAKLFPSRSTLFEQHGGLHPVPQTPS